MVHRIEETIDRGLCVGCGACAIASGGTIQVRLTSTRMYQADLASAREQEIRAASRVCPFSDEAPNEDSLGPAGGPITLHQHPLLGSYSHLMAGRVNDALFTQGSSSGGLASWFAQRLIADRVVDGALAVGRRVGETELFGYEITTTPSSPNHRKSSYYATTMVDVLKKLENLDGRYALIAIPCFIKAVRSLALDRPDIAAKLPVYIGLVCGHLKTQAFAESIAWQAEVPPDLLEAVDFRVKREERTASDYDFGAKASDSSEWNYRRMSSIVGGNWGHGLFQPECCNYCDDVVAETASISFGDAWIPRYTADGRGTNIVICRDQSLKKYFDAASESGEITVEDLGEEDVVASQAGGFRHRRQGLALRLSDDVDAGFSVPQKRVSPNSHSVSRRRARALRQRRHMSAISHAAFAAAKDARSLSVYLDTMAAEIRKYDQLTLSRRTRARRALKTAARHLSRVWRYHTSRVCCMDR